MEKKGKDMNCSLYGSRTCALLNMGACENCPVDKDVPAETVAEDVALFTSLLPEEGVSSLFTGEECALCKGESKGKKAGYGIFDMGHGDPREKKQKANPFKRARWGFLVPLQFACCKKCRRRLLLLEYLPLVSTVVFLGIALPFAAVEKLAQSLRAINTGLPLYVMLGAGVLGFAGGLLWKKVLENRFDRVMYRSVLTHPLVKKMTALGWEPLSEGKLPKLVFTKKRIANGLGTAESDGWDEGNSRE